MDGWSLLEKKVLIGIKPVFVIAGKEYFLKSLVCGILEQELIPEGAELARSGYDGEHVEWSSIKDDLDMPPFGSPIRLVLIKSADEFVSKYREKLEKYLERPSRCGVLTLEVMTWKSNTRLAKIIPEQQLFQCEPRSAKTMASFLAKWCKQQYQKNLSNDAVQLLIEQVEPDFGLLHQELAKLAVYVGDRESITGKDVDELVSRNRSSTVWLMLDALAANQPAEALGTLHQLLQRGEDPIGLFAGITWQLRKLAQTHRLIREGVSLQGAMAQAGLPPFKVQTVQQHLKLLGDRSNRIFEWLMEAEIALKSSTGTAPGTIVEKLLLRLT